MQLNITKEGWKPITLVAGIVASSAVGLNTDINLHSNIDGLLDNPQTVEYLQEVDDFNELEMNERRRFYNYYNSWVSQTAFLSSVKDIIYQDDFQRIIGMGKTAIPYILEIIEAKPSNLVWALNMICKEKISEKQLTIKEACKLWVRKLKK